MGAAKVRSEGEVPRETLLTMWLSGHAQLGMLPRLFVSSRLLQVAAWQAIFADAREAEE